MGENKTEETNGVARRVPVAEQLDIKLNEEICGE